MQTPTLAVLAGGAGSRMGQPKGNLRVGNRAILEYLLDQFAWCGPTILVTAPGTEHPPGAQRFDREVSDPIAGAGPLRGLLTALQTTATDLLVITTVDMLRISVEHLSWIARQLADRPALLGLMMTHDDQIEPFPSAYRSAAIRIAAEQLSHNKRSMHGLLKRPGFDSIPAPADWKSEIWTNVNTPEDMQPFL
jgi:molybdopterin-guanine dinucleotide biosynthesis protein A